MDPGLNRRGFIAAASAAGASFCVRTGSASEDKPALLGGQPIRREPFPSWPVVGGGAEKALLDVLHSGKWYRGDGKRVMEFEAAFAEMIGVRYCVAVANGTSALHTSLAALGVGPGDEVIVPPYTFIATVNAVLLQYALPIFVDTDPDTFQIDARKVEAAMTERTAAIIPVHIGGAPADLDTILAAAGKRNVPVIEDACQAHLAEWRNRRVGSWGATGCFSFQVSKHINSGEGGAVTTNDADLAARCRGFHNHFRGLSEIGEIAKLSGRSCNLRMTEFQGALLKAQMAKAEEQASIREQNARYLTGLLKEMPGIRPMAMHEGVTRSAYHFFMFRYQKEAFEGLSRPRFIQALSAEGIPAFGGYGGPLNKQPFLRAALASRAFRKIFPKEVLDGWEERNQCPVNDRLCDEAVWLMQRLLLGTRRDMDQIAEAIRKIRTHAAALAKA